jgi:predicted TPR repeat methyltransferase
MTDQKQSTTADRANQLLVEGLLVAGRQREAIDLCRRHCHTPGASPQDWLMYGCLCADTGDIATAETALQKAVELNAGLAEAHFGLGKLLVAKGKYPKAVERLQMAAQLRPDNADIWLTLGITCGLAKQADKAEEYCRRSLELDPRSAQARFNLANALQAQGKLSEAETEYEATLQIEPGLAVAWSMLAQARVGLRKYDEAEVAATRALALDPRMGEAHYTLGNISDDLGDTERARAHFHQATEFLPKLPDAHWRLGQTLMKLKEYSGAAESFQVVLNIDPGLARVHAAMGDSFYQRKLHGRAENCYRKALALSNDYLDAHLGLAFSLRAMERNDEFAKQLSECLRIDPNDGQIRHLLAAVRGETPPTAPADYVRKVFDGYADNFDSQLVGALNYHIPEILHELVSQQVAPSANSLDIIDLGCGTGLCAPLFRGMARTLHGVDLSPRMIEKARARNLYDTLKIGDVTASLKSKVAAWDFAISTDVFIYVGDLQEIFVACFSALKPGGLFAFSVESGDDSETFVLRNTGRYAHASGYIRSLSAATGFHEVTCRNVVVRKEGLEDIQGYLFLLRRMDDALQ